MGKINTVAVKPLHKKKFAFRYSLFRIFEIYVCEL
jgi:hypothetical protein